MSIFYLHGIAQVTAVVLSFYALWLGSLRFRSLHLGQKTVFPRPRHILTGKLALYVILAGTFGGAVLARWHTGVWLASGEHAEMGLAVAVLAILGLITGLYLARSPARRTLLPLVHGLVNAAMLVMAVANVFEGIEIMEHHLH